MRKLFIYEVTEISVFAYVFFCLFSFKPKQIFFISVLLYNLPINLNPIKNNIFLHHLIELKVFDYM